MNDLFFSSKGSSTVTRAMAGKIIIPSKDLTDSAGTQDLSVMLLTNILKMLMILAKMALEDYDSFSGS